MTEEEFLAALHVMGVTRKTSTSRIGAYEYTWRDKWIGWAAMDVFDRVSPEDLLRTIRHHIHDITDECPRKTYSEPYGTIYTT